MSLPLLWQQLGTCGFRCGVWSALWCAICRATRHHESSLRYGGKGGGKDNSKGKGKGKTGDAWWHVSTELEWAHRLLNSRVWVFPALWTQSSWPLALELSHFCWVGETVALLHPFGQGGKWQREARQKRRLPGDSSAVPRSQENGAVNWCSLQSLVIAVP